MRHVGKHDFAIVPLHVAKGMKAHEQTVLFWMWAYALSGTPWTWTELCEMAGTTGATAQKAVEQWQQEGLVYEIPEAERGGNKPSHRFGLVCGLCPDRPQEAPEAPKKAEKIEGWVFAAIETWKRHRGIVGPRMVKNALGLAVQVHGSKRVLDALDRYASKADPRWNPSMTHFVLNLEKWADRHDSPGMVPRGMVEEETETKPKVDGVKVEAGGVPGVEDYGPILF